MVAVDCMAIFTGGLLLYCKASALGLMMLQCVALAAVTAACYRLMYVRCATPGSALHLRTMFYDCRSFILVIAKLLLLSHEMQAALALGSHFCLPRLCAAMVGHIVYGLSEWRAAGHAAACVLMY